MLRDPAKGHAALRRGRYSIAEAEYFLTLCTNARRDGLQTAELTTAIIGEAQLMALDNIWRLRCIVVMPDHAHLLVVLGKRLSLGKTVARLKAKTAAVLRQTDPQLSWERGFFDHRVRADEDHLPLFLYIFLNPYRAKLCHREIPWVGYYCAADDWTWFRHELDSDRPQPEWLA